MKKFFEDNEGNTSSMRIVWTITVLTIVFTWAYISLTTGVLQSFTMGDAAWFAALFGGKVAQSYVENRPTVSTRRIRRSCDGDNGDDSDSD